MHDWERYYLENRAPAAADMDDQEAIDVLERFHDPVVVKEKDGRWLYANKEALCLFDLKRHGDWAGSTLPEILARRPSIKLEVTESNEGRRVVRHCNVAVGEDVNAQFRVDEYHLGDPGISVSVWRRQGVIREASPIGSRFVPCDAMDVVQSIDKVRMHLDEMPDARSAYRHLCTELSSLSCIGHVVILGAERRNIIARSAKISEEKQELLRTLKLSKTPIHCKNVDSLLVCFPIRHNETIWAVMFFSSAFPPEKVSLNVIQLAMRDFSSEIDMRYAAKRVKAMLGNHIHMESIVNNSIDSIMLIDTSSMRIIYANQACYRRLGYEKNEITERTPCEINRHMTERKMESFMSQVVRAGRKKSFRTHLTCKNGDSFPVQINLSPSLRKGEGGIVICIAKDMSELSKYETEVLESESRFRHLSEYMRNSMEEEKLRVSREVHDTIGGSISGIMFELRQLCQDVCTSKDLMVKYTPQFDRILEQCEETLDAARDISSQMRPSILDRFGIMASLEWLKKNFEQHHNIPCVLTVSDGAVSEKSSDNYQATLIDEAAEPVPSENLTTIQATHIYRIAQESLNNILKHANASLVRISATCTKDVFEMRIFDDGVGMASHRPGLPTMGILGMKERARSANGSLSIKSHPGRGTTVTLRVRMPELTKNEASIE